MFRIDKSVVKVSSPAEIPLIPIPAPQFAAQEPETDYAAEEDFKEETDGEAEAGDGEAAPEEIAAPQEMVAAWEEQRQRKLLEAQQEAAEIIRQAEQQAEEKQKNLDKQAMAIRENAQREGYEMGEQEALQVYSKQQREAALQLSRLLAEIAAAEEQFWAGAEGQLLDLALAVAEKIVKTSLKDRAVFEAMVKNALKNMRREGKIVVRVSEQQYNDFFQADSATFVLGEETIKAEIIADPQLQPGDLLLESEDEAINAGADSQLKYIALAFGRPWESNS